MIKVDRKDIVIVWQDNTNERPTCRFCAIRGQFHSHYVDVDGNCPIGYGYCSCIRTNTDISFSNIDNIVYTTVYKCFIQGTKCHRKCNRCAINKVIQSMHGD